MASSVELQLWELLGLDWRTDRIFDIKDLKYSYSYTRFDFDSKLNFISAPIEGLKLGISILVVQIRVRQQSDGVFKFNDSDGSYSDIWFEFLWTVNFLPLEYVLQKIVEF